MGQLLNNPILHRSKLNPGPDECRGKSDGQQLPIITTVFGSFLPWLLHDMGES